MSPLTVDESCGRKRKLEEMRGPLDDAKEVWVKIRDQSVQKLQNPTLPQRKKFKEREALMIRLTYVRAYYAVKAIEKNNAYCGSDFPTIYHQSSTVPCPKRQHVSSGEDSECKDFLSWHSAPFTPAPSAMEVDKVDGCPSQSSSHCLPVSPLTEKSTSCTSVGEMDSDLAMDGFNSDLHLPFNASCTPVTGPCTLPESDPTMSYTSLGSTSEVKHDLGSSTLSSIPSSPSSTPSSPYSASSSLCDAPASQATVPLGSDDSNAELMSGIECMSLEELSHILQELDKIGDDGCGHWCAQNLDQMSPGDGVNPELPVLPVDTVCSLFDSVEQLPVASTDSSYVPTGAEFDDIDWEEFCF